MLLRDKTRVHLVPFVVICWANILKITEHELSIQARTISELTTSQGPSPSNSWFSQFREKPSIAMEVERCPDAILHAGLPSGPLHPVNLAPSTMMDQFDRSAEEQLSSADMKKRTFNIRKTAISMVNGMRRKKKDSGEVKTKSQDDLRNESGDQAAKQSSFNKLFNHLPRPKLGIWKSQNSKSPDSQSESPVDVDGSRSTMTLGRIFGRKKECALPVVKEERKALTLGRMFTFKSPVARKVENPPNSPPKIESDD